MGDAAPKRDPAHRTEHFAELVCSNSLGNLALETASGLLKEELRHLGSVILRCADANSGPGRRRPRGCPRGLPARRYARRCAPTRNIRVVRKEATDLPDGPTVVATGPLTSDALAEKIEDLSGETLYFYDAASPIIHRDSLDDSIIYRASRYGKGEAAYLNCPMTEEQYYAFVEDLAAAELSPIKDFEEDMYFEGCLPVETIARRGKDTLRFGPMKPVGLPDPHTGGIPYAVVQLRQDDAEGRLYNIVGFQTRLKWGEQRRVFRTIPGLQNADFARMGVMHRNTYLPSNHMLEATMRIREALGEAPLFFAGQLTGVEGYVESTAMGHIAGTNAARLARGEEPTNHAARHHDGGPRPLHHHQRRHPPAHKLQLGPRPHRSEARERQTPQQTRTQATPGQDGALHAR